MRIAKSYNNGIPVDYFAVDFCKDGLIGHYRADNITIPIDSMVTVLLNQVSGLSDMTGSGVLKGNIFNSNQALLLDGTGFSTSNSMQLNDFTVFIVIQGTGTNNYEYIFDHHYGNGFAFYRHATDPDLFRFPIKEPGAPFGAAVTLNISTPTVLAFTREGLERQVFNSLNLIHTSSCLDTITADTAFGIGRNLNSTNGLQGYFSECLIYDTALTSYQKKKTLTYLTKKYIT